MNQEEYNLTYSISQEQRNFLEMIRDSNNYQKNREELKTYFANQNFNYFLDALTQMKVQVKFFSETLSKMANETLQFHASDTKIQLMVQPNQEQHLNRRVVYQIFCLLFFNLLPKQTGFTFPDRTLQDLYRCGNHKQVIEKIKCFIHYFICGPLNEKETLILRRVSFDPQYHIKQCFNSNVQALDETLWIGSDAPLKQIEFTIAKIESYQNCSIVDFANKYLGGGVLGQGCVQEEILFSIMPECIVSIILASVLKEQDAFFIENALQYSNYEGYASKFKFKPQEPLNLNQNVIAIDALHYYNPEQQWVNQKILRDLNKAFIGFWIQNQEYSNKNIVSGKWGCGAFRGDVELKLIIQFLAFSQASLNKTSKLIFSTFNDEDQSKQFDKLMIQIIQKYKNVGNLAKALFNLTSRKGGLLFQLLSI